MLLPQNGAPHRGSRADTGHGEHGGRLSKLDSAPRTGARRRSREARPSLPPEKTRRAWCGSGRLRGQNPTCLICDTRGLHLKRQRKGLAGHLTCYECKAQPGTWIEVFCVERKARIFRGEVTTFLLSCSQEAIWLD